MTAHLTKDRAPHGSPRKVDSSTTSLAPHFKCFDKAASIAEYYGFNRLPHIDINRHDVALTRSLKNMSEDKSHITSIINIEELTTMLNAFANRKFQNLSIPIMTYYEGHLNHEGNRTTAGDRYFVLDVIGSSKSMVEGILIQTAYTILREEHAKNLTIELNSVGDKDSFAKFSREIGNYFKKTADEIPKELKSILKKDPISVLTADTPQAKEIAHKAPPSISYLTEASRMHFKEVLECIETLGIPYRIDPTLLPDRNYCSETTFVIRDGNEEKIQPPYALGIRYNGLAKKIGFKKEIPAARVIIHLPKVKMEVVKTVPKKAKIPRFYFIQIGFEAKLKSLQVVEMLREAKIPLTYSLIKDKLTGQLVSAEQLHTPYILLMGQKESMENTVLVRNMNNSSQETIPISDLVNYLKKLK